MRELDRDTAREWIERWDRQQEEGLADREDRFTALIDAVEEGTGRPDPLILDIGCGPGSLGVRLLARLPRATVVGIDADPVSLTLGRAAYSDVPGLRFAEEDLRLPGWAARLRPGNPGAGRRGEHHRAALAARARAARHVRRASLRAAPRRPPARRRSLRPRRQGIPGPGPPGPEFRQREDKRRFPGGHPENWHDWWDAAAADPVLAAHVAERARRQVEAGHHESQSTFLATHVEALRAAASPRSAPSGSAATTACCAGYAGGDGLSRCSMAFSRAAIEVSRPMSSSTAGAAGAAAVAEPASRCPNSSSMTCCRARSWSTPAAASSRAAPPPSRMSPRRMCSVPM